MDATKAFGAVPEPRCPAKLTLPSAPLLESPKCLSRLATAKTSSNSVMYGVLQWAPYIGSKVQIGEFTLESRVEKVRRSIFGIPLLHLMFEPEGDRATQGLNQTVLSAACDHEVICFVIWRGGQNRHYACPLRGHSETGCELWEAYVPNLYLNVVQFWIILCDSRYCCPLPRTQLNFSRLFHRHGLG